jgi:type III restriction enzyme
LKPWRRSSSLTEAAEKIGDNWIKTWLGEVNAASNPGLTRIAMKMATGTGKTVVMAMLIAWHALNKIANTKDSRFSDTFLVVTPGITIRDRLRVLWPHDAENYYRLRDLVPPQGLRITIANLGHMESFIY